jgi:hypothetical protein
MVDPRQGSAVTERRNSGWLARAAGPLLSALIGAPMELPVSLLEAYPELAEAHWRRGGIPPRLGGWFLAQSTVSGITFGRTIWLAPHAPYAPELLLHELRHVHQFAADRAFPLRYVWLSLRHGYSRNPYETDARTYAANRVVGLPPTV